MRNGVSTPGDGQLAVELINSAFRFGERYPTTTEQQIIEALGLAQRAVMRQREALEATLAKQDLGGHARRLARSRRPDAA